MIDNFTKELEKIIKDNNLKLNNFDNMKNITFLNKNAEYIINDKDYVNGTVFKLKKSNKQINNVKYKDMSFEKYSGHLYVDYKDVKIISVDFYEKKMTTIIKYDDI
jgi:NACalpha-BTF3-like transcription factor